mgnify:CR=1 FL=1
MEIHHYIQNWKDYKKVIVVSDEGSVFVGLYEFPVYCPTSSQYLPAPPQVLQFLEPLQLGQVREEEPLLPLL